MVKKESKINAEWKKQIKRRETSMRIIAGIVAGIFILSLFVHLFIYNI